MEAPAPIKPSPKEAMTSSKIGEATNPAIEVNRSGKIPMDALPGLTSGFKPDLSIQIGRNGVGSAEGNGITDNLAKLKKKAEGGSGEDASDSELRKALTVIPETAKLTLEPKDITKALEGYQGSIINPEFKQKISRIFKLRGVKRALLGGLAAVMLVIAGDEGPKVTGEAEAAGRQGDEAPQAQQLTPEQMADLVKANIGPMFFESTVKPPAFPIPKEQGYKPVLGPEQPKAVEPWERIRNDDPGESLSGWARKYAITLANKEVMVATLENAKQMGVKVTDPSEFAQMYDQDPQAAKGIFSVLYRGLEGVGAQLPSDHPLLTKKENQPNPDILTAFVSSLKESIALKNKPGAIGADGDLLVNAQTNIDKPFLRLEQATAKTTGGKAPAK